MQHVEQDEGINTKLLCSLIPDTKREIAFPQAAQSAQQGAQGEAANLSNALDQAKQEVMALTDKVTSLFFRIL
jgi:hypothetical protein